MTELQPRTTSSQLPIRKRKKTEDDDESSRNITTSTSESNLSNNNDDAIQQTAASTTTDETQTKIMKMTPKDDKYQQQLSVINSTKRVTTKTPNKARETRLEQNRKAARESRRRKKVMVEDLQRSVIFFSRANGTIKHQNDELTRFLMQAQAQASVIESTKTVDQQQQQQQQNLPASNKSEPTLQSSTSTTTNSTNVPVQAATSTVITATAAPAGTYVAAPSSLSYPSFPVMQTGATMQAMANFQQAAAAAMQAAVQGMQQGSIPGVSLNSLAQPAPTNGSSAQQAYNDTMTALAMQQAAVAAAATTGGQRQTTFFPGATLVPPQFITQAIQQHAVATHQQPIAPVEVAPPTQSSTTLPPDPAPAQPLSAIATKGKE
jgi:hypothetical protein